MEQELIKKLKLVGICTENKYEIINNQDCIVLPVAICSELFFFKFLDKKMYDKICLEVNFVNKLFEAGIKVHEYYNLKGTSVFIDDGCCFYGTKYVGTQNIVKNHDHNILSEVIINIAKMHNELGKIPYIEYENVVKKSNDYLELYAYYTKNKKIICENNFSPFIDKVLENGFEPKDYLFIHYDLNFKNIMIDNNCFSGFIDFTDYKIGYREDDIGKFFQNVIYLDSITNKDIDNFIQLYNKHSNADISIQNLKISMIYRIIYRYFCAIKENTVDETYKEKTQKILKKIINF